MTRNTNSRQAIRIHPATADDADFILSLVPRFVAFGLPKGRFKREVAAGVRTEIQRALHAPRRGERFFIAQDAAGKRCGFLHLRTERDFFSGKRACHVSNLAVAKGRDGQGIGSALLDHARTWAKGHRCLLLTLSVFPGNTRARALYERAGFTVDLLRMARPAGRK